MALLLAVTFELMGSQTNYHFESRVRILHSPQTSRWPQVVAQTRDIRLAFGGCRLLLLQGHGPRHGSQQADILTSEIAAIRRSLEPVAERICEWWLRLKGYDDRVKVDWLDVNLQDEESEARAALYRAQARAVEEEKDGTV